MSDEAKRHHTDSMAPAILAMHSAGSPSIDIAATLKCSRANVSQTLKLYGRKSLTKGGRRKKPEPATECPIAPPTDQA